MQIIFLFDCHFRLLLCFHFEYQSVFGRTVCTALYRRFFFFLFLLSAVCARPAAFFQLNSPENCCENQNMDWKIDMDVCMYVYK